MSLAVNFLSPLNPMISTNALFIQFINFHEYLINIEMCYFNINLTHSENQILRYSK